MQMQQRGTVSSRAVTLVAEEDHCVIDVEVLPQPEGLWKWRIEQNSDSDTADLPFSGKKEVLRERMATRCIHSIPFIILFCFFALWWFSAPANLVIKDGRIVEAHNMRMSLVPLSFNGTHVELASLASATPPAASVPQNGTEATPCC